MALASAVAVPVESPCVTPETPMGPSIIAPPPTPLVTARAVPVQNIPSGVQILKDVTGHSDCKGKITDFARYFGDRYEKLRRILRRKPEMGGVGDLMTAKKRGGEVRVIAIVSEKRETKKGGMIITLEDTSGSMNAWLSTGGDSPVAGETLLLDEVVGIVGKVSAKGLLVINSIIRPDVPAVRERRYAPAQALVAFLSDIHVGSNTFLEERFDTCIDWLAGSDETAKLVKYVVIAGDLVDGIGIYPNQEKELLIDDVYAQYQALGAKLARIPPSKTIIVVPGNHDAVRPAEPQPAFAEHIRATMPHPNIIFVGNPCTFSLDGVVVLAYHGKSFDDVIAAIPHASYGQPLPVMRELLRRRHLAPIYGEKTPLAPEWHDYLVIDEVPDIIVTGHVHQYGIESYRGVTLINASCWQSQTDYQRMFNQVPDPCKVPIVDLSSGRYTVKIF
jgi:DNA polymerase II small subunit